MGPTAPPYSTAKDHSPGAAHPGDAVDAATGEQLQRVVNETRTETTR
ncbi:hypothetical protein ACFV23_15560 [Streptomyces sp. NPDC059627]